MMLAFPASCCSRHASSCTQHPEGAAVGVGGVPAWTGNGAALNIAHGMCRKDIRTSIVLADGITFQRRALVGLHPGLVEPVPVTPGWSSLSRAAPAWGSRRQERCSLWSPKIIQSPFRQRTCAKEAALVTSVTADDVMLDTQHWGWGSSSHALN